MRLNQATYIQIFQTELQACLHGVKWLGNCSTNTSCMQTEISPIQCVAVNICRCLGPISLTYTGLRTSNCTCNPITNIVSQFVRAVRHHIVLHVVSVSFPDSQKWSGDNAYTGRLRLDQLPIHNISSPTIKLAGCQLEHAWRVRCTVWNHVVYYGWQARQAAGKHEQG